MENNEFISEKINITKPKIVIINAASPEITPANIKNKTVIIKEMIKNNKVILRIIETPQYRITIYIIYHIIS